MARRRSGGSRRRVYRKIRRSAKPKMFKSVAVCATAIGAGVMVTGVGAAAVDQLVNAAKSIPMIGSYIAGGGTIVGALWLLKLVGGSWWAGKVRSILGPKWRP